MYALVDGNNFFCSCERVFRPSLKNHPVVVLSSNDGCTVARSNEAKALGIKMGQPWFECRELAETHGVVALSANFTLYGDMSDRMMCIAAGLGHAQEIYSIDECFCDMSGIRGDLRLRAEKMRQRILQCTGLPTGIGIGPTKTLAKLANHVAKTAERKPGSYPEDLARVCHLGLLPPSDLDAVMAATEVGEVWGIGRRIGKQLQEAGISTVLQFVNLDPATVRRRWSVVLERTLRELQGQACIALDDAPPPRQEIAHTRSFGRPVRSLQALSEAVTEFASGAALKLRHQGGLAGRVSVFVHTSPFRPPPHYSRHTSVPLRRPTDHTQDLVGAALVGLRAIYRPGYDFVKAGVMLLDLQGRGVGQGELDLEPEPAERGALMSALDHINDRYGRGTLVLASAGTGGARRAWSMRQNLLTPAYTTSWDDLPIARA